MAYVNERPSVNFAQILQGAGKIKVDGVELGGFQGGVIYEYTENELYVTSDVKPGEVDSEVQSREFTVRTELEEGTLENLALALGIPTSSVASGTSSKVLNLIPQNGKPFKELVFEGMSATNRDLVRTWTIPNSKKIEGSGGTLMRGTKLVTPTAFRAFVDANGSYGTVVDQTVE